jgi:trehalose 6-phosphate phosphatase
VYDNVGLIRQVLELLGHGPAGLVTDIDGTISPIVARPEEAAVLPEARNTLEGLRDKLDVVAVVTGRSVADARRMVGVDGLMYIGNHGLEVYRNGHPEIVAEAKPWVARLAELLRQVNLNLDPALRSGVIVENKGVSASIHYRLTPDPDEARLHLLELLARGTQTTGIRVEEGRRVLNLLPPLNINKGTAVTRLVTEHKLEGVVYVGDDITDAHAFQALQVLRQTQHLATLSIGVVGPETPEAVRQHADAAVPSVTAVAQLLNGVLAGLESNDRMDVRAPSVGSN